MSVQINLVPESARKKKHAGVFPIKSFHLPREVVIGLVGGLVALLVVVHVLLQALITVQFVQLHRYHKMQEQLAPEKTNVDRILGELRKVQANLKMIDGISKTQKIFWAEKLNAISDTITRGVWLEKMSLEGKKFTLSGSAVSKSASEMIEVNNFISKLKSNAVFAGNFTKIEPGTIKTRKVNNTPVADFTITANVK